MRNSHAVQLVGTTSLRYGTSGALLRDRMKKQTKRLALRTTTVAVLTKEKLQLVGGGNNGSDETLHPETATKSHGYAACVSDGG